MSVCHKGSGDLTKVKPAGDRPDCEMKPSPKGAAEVTRVFMLLGVVQIECRWYLC